MVVTVCVVLGVGAGCSEEELRLAGAEAELCAATREVDDAAERFQAVDLETAPPEEIRAAQDDLQNAIADAVADAAEVAEARADAGENPVAEFNASVEAIPDDASADEIVATMVEATGEFMHDAADFLRRPACS